MTDGNCMDFYIDRCIAQKVSILDMRQLQQKLKLHKYSSLEEIQAHCYKLTDYDFLFVSQA
jgi:hypothetical protein